MRVSQFSDLALKLHYAKDIGNYLWSFQFIPYFAEQWVVDFKVTSHLPKSLQCVPDWMEKAVRRYTDSAEAHQINAWHLISHTSCKQSINAPALAPNTNSIHMTGFISACPNLHAKWRLDTGSG